MDFQVSFSCVHPIFTSHWNYVIWQRSSWSVCRSGPGFNDVSVDCLSFKLCALPSATLNFVGLIIIIRKNWLQLLGASEGMIFFDLVFATSSFVIVPRSSIINHYVLRFVGPLVNIRLTYWISYSKPQII